MTWRRLLVGSLIAAVAAPAAGLETDQYWAWGRPLSDSTDAVNARFNLELQRAIDGFAEHRQPETCRKIAVAYRKRLRFLLLHSPCPTGWKSEPAESLQLVRLAVASGLFLLYEVKDGRTYRLNVEPDWTDPANSLAWLLASAIFVVAVTQWTDPVRPGVFGQFQEAPRFLLETLLGVAAGLALLYLLLLLGQPIIEGRFGLRLDEVASPAGLPDVGHDGVGRGGHRRRGGPGRAAARHHGDL